MLDRSRAALTCHVCVFLLLGAFSALILFPPVWALSTSLKPEKEMLQYPPTILPAQWYLGNYRALFIAMPFARSLLNSFIVSSLSVCLTIFAGLMAAYVIARKEFIGKELVFLLFLLCMMLPGLTNIIPMFLLMGKLKLLNTYAALVLLYSAGNVAFSIWLLRGFIASIPQELDEAAILDGCSQFVILRRIIFPLAVPGITATAILIFISCWNEFIVAVTFTNKETMRTLTVAIYFFKTYWNVQWGSIMAASVLAIVPVLAFFAVMQRQLLAGLTKGAFR